MVKQGGSSTASKASLRGLPVPRRVRAMGLPVWSAKTAALSFSCNRSGKPEPRGSRPGFATVASGLPRGLVALLPKDRVVSQRLFQHHGEWTYGSFRLESSLSFIASWSNAQTQIDGGHYESGCRSLLRVLNHGAARRPCGGQASE